METKSQVLITGGTGYVGNHIVKEFVEDGSFKVRTTTTSLSNPTKVEGLKAALTEKFNTIEILELSLLKPDHIDKAIAGCIQQLQTQLVL
jgi:nucleoside-diphosphate-sugar epimerase